MVILRLPKDVVAEALADEGVIEACLRVEGGGAEPAVVAIFGVEVLAVVEPVGSDATSGLSDTLALGVVAVADGGCSVCDLGELVEGVPAVASGAVAAEVAVGVVG